MLDTLRQAMQRAELPTQPAAKVQRFPTDALEANAIRANSKVVGCESALGIAIEHLKRAVEEGEAAVRDADAALAEAVKEREAAQNALLRRLVESGALEGRDVSQLLKEVEQ